MISVAIIDDHQVLVDALELLLSTDEDFCVLGKAGSVETGLALLKDHSPDVLLLDIGLPDGDGLSLIPFIKQNCPDVNVVVLTSANHEPSLMRAIDSGVSGFLTKGCSLNELLDTIRKAAAGEIVMPASLLLGLLKRVPRDRAAVSRNEMIWEQLTPRELDILYHLASGKSGEAIAAELHIAPLTVRTHVRNLMSKLGVHSRLEAVAFGMRHGLLEAQAIL